MTYRDGFNEEPSFPVPMGCNAGTFVDGEYQSCQNDATEVVASVNQKVYMLCVEHVGILPAHLDLLRSGGEGV